MKLRYILLITFCCAVVVITAVWAWWPEREVREWPQFNLPPATQPVEIVWWAEDGNMNACHGVSEPAASWLRRLISSSPAICQRDDLHFDPVGIAYFRIDGVQYAWNQDALFRAVYTGRGRTWDVKSIKVWRARELEQMLQAYGSEPKTTTSSWTSMLSGLTVAVEQSAQPTTRADKTAPQ